MKYDITEKMNFEENPKIQIKNKTVEVQADAKTVLKMLEVADSSEDNYTSTMKAYYLIFSEEDRKKIESLNLNAHDFGILISTAMTLAVGGDPDEEGNE